MYAKILIFLVGIDGIYWGIFYKMYLLPCITIPYPFNIGAV